MNMGLRKYSLFGGLALGVIAMGILLFWKGYNEEVDQSPFLQEAKSQEEKSLMQIGAMGAKARSLDETDTYADVFLQFDNWMNRYLLARTEGLRQKLLREGVSLASRRRSLMKWLINENPELALSLAVSEEIQK